jgi:subtilase family serine protease
MNSRSIAAFAAAASLILVSTALNIQAQEEPGRIVVPSSSIERPEDAGLRAHTNIILNLRPPTPGPGSTWETPASIACVYQIVTQVSGCPISGTTTHPSGGSGAIAIVDAYDDPTAVADLQAFSSQFGLPTATFQVVYATGTKPAQDSTGGWELEEALDIEWAHAMAPNAKIYLVEAASNSNSDLYTAESVASSLVATAGGGEVTNSWSGPEYSSEASDAAKYFSTPNVVYFASTGDVTLKIGSPSVFAQVVAAGGTRINRTGGNYTSETYWDTSSTEGGGGGVSTYISIPAYQEQYSITTIVGVHRGVPDISSDADPASGVAVYDSTAYEGTVYDWIQVGGTSVSSPTLAGRANATGIYANSNSLLTNMYYEYASSTLYPANFRDITSGNSNCKTGWDICDGIGSPLASKWGPNATATLTPASWNFGQHYPSDPPQNHTFTLMNTGSGTLNIYNFGALYDPFKYTSTTCGSSLGAGASCTVTLTFIPSEAPNGLSKATFLLSDSAASSPQAVALSGTVSCPGGECE